MKQKLKKWLYVVGLLCMSMSCKEKIADCDIDASCCDPVNTDAGYKLIAKLENEPADLSRTALFFKKGFKVPDYEYISNMPQHSIPVCWGGDNYDKLIGLPLTTNTNDYENTPYKYRVWGRIFWDSNIHGITGVPFLFSQIDRIEKIN